MIPIPYVDTLLVMLCGLVLIRLSRRKPSHPTCGGCGQNLDKHAIESHKCPACDIDLNTVGIKMIATRRNNPVLAALGIAILTPFLISLFLIFIVIAYARLAGY